MRYRAPAGVLIALGLAAVAGVGLALVALRRDEDAQPVLPHIQHADRRYRLDFLIYYDGRGVAVELDGHDYHKTKEQRGYDAERDRWLLARGIRVVRFTGSQVYADAEGCVRELLDVIRQSQARP